MAVADTGRCNWNFFTMFICSLGSRIVSSMHSLMLAIIFLSLFLEQIDCIHNLSGVRLCHQSPRPGVLLSTFHLCQFLKCSWVSYKGYCSSVYPFDEISAVELGFPKFSSDVLFSNFFLSFLFVWWCSLPVFTRN